jgi:hypothetical protein
MKPGANLTLSVLDFIPEREAIYSGIVSFQAQRCLNLNTLKSESEYASRLGLTCRVDQGRSGGLARCSAPRALSISTRLHAPPPPARSDGRARAQRVVPAPPPTHPFRWCATAAGIRVTAQADTARARTRAQVWAKAVFAWRADMRPITRCLPHVLRPCVVCVLRRINECSLSSPYAQPHMLRRA